VTTTPNHSPTDTDDDLTQSGKSDDLLLPGQRVTIFWWTPFDRPIVLTALALAAGTQPPPADDVGTSATEQASGREVSS